MCCQAVSFGPCCNRSSMLKLVSDIRTPRNYSITKRAAAVGRTVCQGDFGACGASNCTCAFGGVPCTGGRNVAGLSLNEGTGASRPITAPKVGWSRITGIRNGELNAGLTLTDTLGSSDCCNGEP